MPSCLDARLARSTTGNEVGDPPKGVVDGGLSIPHSITYSVVMIQEAKNSVLRFTESSPWSKTWPMTGIAWLKIEDACKKQFSQYRTDSVTPDMMGEGV